MDAETRNALATAAREAGLDSVGLMAVAEVESGGHAFATFDGRREPLIRFEGHYFDRRLAGSLLAQARQARLAHPIAGRIANPADQRGRWRMLDRAAEISRKAAYESVSWGLGQVMGAHWAWLGYADVDALAAEARSGALGQARLMARFIVKAGLADALSGRSWAAFARGYNGPGFRRNSYDRKLSAAYARLKASSVESEKTMDGTLTRGAAGQAVANLQRALAAAGYPVAIDARFGPETAAAVSAFQTAAGLPATGEADAATLARLAQGLSLGHRLLALWHRLLRLAGFV